MQQNTMFISISICWEYCLASVLGHLDHIHRIGGHFVFCLLGLFVSMSAYLSQSFNLDFNIKIQSFHTQPPNCTIDKLYPQDKLRDDMFKGYGHQGPKIARVKVYCFAHVGWSVGQSVGLSVDKHCLVNN